MYILGELLSLIFHTYLKNHQQNYISRGKTKLVYREQKGNQKEEIRNEALV
jgi:hypothetical protein